jgi:hypothetical protein
MNFPNPSLPPEPLPSQPNGPRIQTCDQISRGDLIEAKHGSTRHLRGQVVDVQPSMELFWVLAQDGSRRIVELAEFEVYFVP